MIESWKTRHTFMDDVNIVTKLFLGVALFFFIIFVHHFDVMIYLATLMLIFMLL
ncbi:energy-coupling factor transporter transmembrane protein EcfT, partial [Staphylococcus pseudintermedius]